MSVLYGSAGGLTATGGRLFTQVGGISRPRTSSASSLAPGTSTVTGSLIWPPVPRGDRRQPVAAGAVSVLYGSGGGLTAAGGRLFTQVGGIVEANDLFGSSLASGDFNHDGVADLAAGAPWRDGLGLTEAGAVSVLYGSAGGLTATGGRLFTQVTPDVQAGDLFGFALATGDVNHDGAADLAAPPSATTSSRRCGERAVRRGRWADHHRRAAVHPRQPWRPRRLRAIRLLRRRPGRREPGGYPRRGLHDQGQLHRPTNPAKPLTQHARGPSRRTAPTAPAFISPRPVLVATGPLGEWSGQAVWCASRDGSSVRPRSWRTWGPRRLRWPSELAGSPLRVTPQLRAVWFSRVCVSQGVLGVDGARPARVVAASMHRPSAPVWLGRMVPIWGGRVPLPAWGLCTVTWRGKRSG